MNGICFILIPRCWQNYEMIGLLAYIYKHGITTLGSSMKSYLKKLKPKLFHYYDQLGFEHKLHFGDSEHSLRCAGKLGTTEVDQEYWVSTEGLILLMVHWSASRNTSANCAIAEYLASAAAVHRLPATCAEDYWLGIANWYSSGYGDLCYLQMQGTSQ